MQIFLIGSGNVATQLGQALKKCGHKITFVYSPTLSHAKKLGRKLNTSFGRSLDASLIARYPSDIYIIAVKDDAIAEVAKKLPALKNSLVIHTSGATDISVLKKKFKNCGVLWQIQTIKAKTKVDFKKILLVIETNNPASKQKLLKLARSLSPKVYTLNSQQRRILHLGAVWVNNFPNHLYYLSQSLLKKNHLPFEIFGPLILSTAMNGMNNPKESQTGPAKRNDKKTMNAHLKLLPDKNYRDLYKLISKSIINTYK
ncbi:MAG: DUF2520 domain-containing protein [Bacteroidetes bacterium]|nr:DUF2520 domain-containing protein [Bacteroidota bacterium]